MDLLSKILSGAAGFVGRNAKALTNSVGNTAGMTKDYIDYNLAKTPQQKQQELMSYNKRYNAANEAMKDFGFDINKKGNQFDPKQYAKGVIGGAGEIGSLMSPMGGGLKARAAINAVPGFTNAISEGKGLGGIVTDTGASMLLGMGGESLVKGAGALMKGLGNKTVDAAENLGLRRYGMTKKDVNKLNEKLGFPVQDFLRQNNLIGKSYDDLGDAIKPLQQSFDDIANRADIKVNPNELLNKFGDTISDLKGQSAPELQRKGADLEKYASNFLLKDGQDFSAKGLTAERRVIDKLVKDFSGAGGDAYSASKNRTVRDTLQEAVRSAADKAGVKGVQGQSLKELGDKLSKMYAFENIAKERAPQPTGLPAGLLRSLAGGQGAGIGVLLGGLPGAVFGGIAGIAGEGVMNNPKIIQQAAQKGVPLGNKMIEAGTKLGANNILQQALGALGRRSGVAIGDSFSGTPISPDGNNENNQEYPNTSPNIQGSRSNLQQPIVPQDPMRQQAEQFTNQVDPNMEIELVGADGKPTGQKIKYSELQGQLSGGGAGGDLGGGMGAPVQQDPFSEKQSQLNNAMLQALTAGDTKAFTELAKISDTMSQLQENQMKFAPGDDLDRQLKMVELETKKQALSSPKGSGKALPQTAVQELSDFDNSVSLLDNLSGVLETKKDKLGPVMGRLSKFNKYDKDAQSVQAELDIAAQVIGKALEGGKLAEGDIARYKTMLPNLNDTPELAQYKIDTLKQKIMNQKGARLQSYNSAGFNDKGLMNQNDMLAQILAAGQM